MVFISNKPRVFNQSLCWLETFRWILGYAILPCVRSFLILQQKALHTPKTQQQSVRLRDMVLATDKIWFFHGDLVEQQQKCILLKNAKERMKTCEMERGFRNLEVRAHWGRSSRLRGAPGNDNRSIFFLVQSCIAKRCAKLPKNSSTPLRSRSATNVIQRDSQHELCTGGLSGFDMTALDRRRR